MIVLLPHSPMDLTTVNIRREILRQSIRLARERLEHVSRQNDSDLINTAAIASSAATLLGYVRQLVWHAKRLADAVTGDTVSK